MKKESINVIKRMRQRKERERRDYVRGAGTIRLPQMEEDIDALKDAEEAMENEIGYREAMKDDGK